MDRNRIIKQIKAKGVPSGGRTLKVLRTLGEGGNGVALLCGAAARGNVVVKIYLPPDTRDLDERALARFESEIKLTSTIRHPNVNKSDRLRKDGSRCVLPAFLHHAICSKYPAGIYHAS